MPPLGAGDVAVAGGGVLVGKVVAVAGSVATLVAPSVTATVLVRPVVAVAAGGSVAVGGKAVLVGS